MDIKLFISNWLKVSNSYNLGKYLEFYHEDAILDDPSVGKKFKGHKGIAQYFQDYFIDYKTQTKLIEFTSEENKAHIEVEFKGEFPGGQVHGTFDFVFENGKIKKVKAELV